MKHNLESDTRLAIESGYKFFECNPDFFPDGGCNPDYANDVPEKLREADEIRKNLNQLAKKLIAMGGKVPPVLWDVTKLLEKFGLILNPDHEGFHTITKVLAKGKLPGPDEKTAWLALRSTLIRRRVEDTLIKTGRIITVNDIIHLMDLRNHKNLPKGDLGWVK